MVFPRPLSPEELQELEVIRAKKEQQAEADKRKFFGTADDITGLIAPHYMKKAFRYGWDDAVAENQKETSTTKDPSNTIYKIAVGVGVGVGAVMVLLFSISSMIAFPAAIPAIIALAVIGGGAIGGGLGFIDGYFEAQKVKGARDFGRSQAQEAVEQIVERADQRAKDKGQSDRITQLEAQIQQLSSGQSMVEKHVNRDAEKQVVAAR